MEKKENRKQLVDTKIDVKVKIAALWVVLMILYIYNDFFSLFTPNAITEIIDGNMGPFPVTQGGLFSAALLMAIPSVMIYLSLTLKAKVNRWTNIVLSVGFIGVMVASIIGEWAFYQFMGVIEIIVNIVIIWLAIKWPTSNENG